MIPSPGQGAGVFVRHQPALVMGAPGGGGLPQVGKAVPKLWDGNRAGEPPARSRSPLLDGVGGMNRVGDTREWGGTHRVGYAGLWGRFHCIT